MIIDALLNKKIYNSSCLQEFNKKRTIFYKNSGFKLSNLKKIIPSKKWIKRCEKFDSETFKKKLLYWK